MEVWVLTPEQRPCVGGVRVTVLGYACFRDFHLITYSLGRDPQVRERNNSRNGINSGQRRGLLLSAGHMQKSAEG